MDNLSPAQQALTRSYADLERQRENDRYQEYLNEEDSEKVPRAFDLGWRRNLLHLFGHRPLLWPVPVCNTTGDGWHWEPSPKFLEARDRIRQQREQDQAEQQKYQRDLYLRNMNNSQGWLGGSGAMPEEPERPATGVSMKTLAPMSPRPRPGDSDYEDDIGEEDHHLLNRDSNNVPGGGPRRPKTTPKRYRQSNSASDEWRDWD